MEKSPLVKLKVKASDFQVECATSFLQVLESPLRSLQQLQGLNSWLHFVVLNIWLSPGNLYFCSSSADPSLEEPTDSWSLADLNEEIRAGYYEYRSDHSLDPSNVTEFRRIERQSDTSATNASQVNKSRTFRTNVLMRDSGQCRVTSSPNLLGTVIASHIVPKRLGDALVNEIFRERGYHGPSLDRWATNNGISLFISVDKIFDAFKGSFYPDVTVGHYRFHVFDEVYQGPLPVGLGIFQLHKSFCDFTTMSPADQSPLPGIVAWHYVQSALQAFGTSEFRRLTTRYSEVPFRARGASDSSSDDQSESQHPAIYRLEPCQAKRSRLLHEEQEKVKVQNWIDDVPCVHACP